MIRQATLPIVLSIFLFAPATLHAAEITLDLGEKGVLALQLPAGWVHEIMSSGTDVPPTVKLQVSDTTAFVAFITPFWAEAGAAPDFGTPAGVRRIVERSAAAVASSAVENPLEIVEIGGGRTGYWFAATDKSLVGQNPGPGEYRYMVQGAAMVGELMCSFTVLTNEKPSAEADRTLDILRSAAHRTGA